MDRIKQSLWHQCLELLRLRRRPKRMKGVSVHVRDFLSDFDSTIEFTADEITTALKVKSNHAFREASVQAVIYKMVKAGSVEKVRRSGHELVYRVKPVVDKMVVTI